MDDIKVSIVITAFNAQEYVLATLESIRQQTYKLYEVVIVDDGSTDDTVATINEYIAKHHLANIFVHALPHMGRAKALNAAIHLAHYDWIAILDSDDLWNHHKLSLQVKYIQQYQLQIIGSLSQIFYNNDPVNLILDYQYNNHTSVFKKITLNEMLVTNLLPHSSVLVNKSLLKYDESRKSQIDYEMWLRLLKNDIDIHLILYPLVHHRLHQAQSFESKNPYIYAMKTSILQLKHCFYHAKLNAAAIVLMKVIYYSTIPRKFRLILRSIFLEKKVSI